MTGGVWRRNGAEHIQACYEMLFAPLNQAKLSCLPGATKNRYEASRHGWRDAPLFYQISFIELKVFIHNSYLVFIPLYAIFIIFLATIGR
jgi:hypothetical protein